jgi:hypothetical protein
VILLISIKLQDLFAMNFYTEEDIREEIRQFDAVPIAQMTEHHFKRLNDLEAEIRRRHPELQQGKFPNTMISRVCLILWFCLIQLQLERGLALNKVG